MVIYFPGVDRSLRLHHPYLRGDTWYMYNGTDILVLSGDDFGRTLHGYAVQEHLKEALTGAFRYAESMEIN